MDREERDKAVYLAKLAEQAERYDGAFTSLSLPTQQFSTVVVAVDRVDFASFWSEGSRTMLRASTL